MFGRIYDISSLLFTFSCLCFVLENIWVIFILVFCFIKNSSGYLWLSIYLYRDWWLHSLTADECVTFKRLLPLRSAAAPAFHAKRRRKTILPSKRQMVNSPYNHLKHSWHFTVIKRDSLFMEKDNYLLNNQLAEFCQYRQKGNVYVAKCGSLQYPPLENWYQVIPTEWAKNGISTPSAWIV